MSLLLAAFRERRCAVCAVLGGLVEDAIRHALDEETTATPLLRRACAQHARAIGVSLAERADLLRKMLDQAARTARRPGRGRGWWPLVARRRDRRECSMCRRLQRAEPRVLAAFAAVVADVRGAKGFRAAAALCRVHEERFVERHAARAAAFLDLQRPKLAALSDRALRHVKVGGDADAVGEGIGYLVPFEAAPRSLDEAPPTSIEPSAANTNTDAPAPAAGTEIALLRWQVGDLTQRLGESDSRASSLHYRVAELVQENRRLQLSNAAAASEARLLRAELEAAWRRAKLLTP